ncbi:MAG: hypothetical protein HC895_14785 [Leptolyngbyaceae cyanobacterium SM1_3_5]|nr:hypothetical protein [Leptolyngbyaceae cyanobacterium SM1_3_5]
MSDYSMLDLFRQEVEAQVASLKQQLMMLKQQPESFDRQAALQALHAIEGIAQMLEVEATVTLTGAMQSKLAEGQLLDEMAIDQLLQASDWLIEISQLNAVEQERWLFSHVSEIDVIQERRFDRDKQLATEVSEAIVKEISASPPIVDAQIMDLFRLEVEEQAKILNEGLLTLETTPNATQPLEVLMRAAHSIKGAARIVGLDAAVNLAHEMEDCFVAAQNYTLTLNPDLINGLLRGVDLLQSLSQVGDRDLPDWLNNHNSDLNSVRSLIDTRRHPVAKPSPKPIAAHPMVQRPLLQRSHRPHRKMHRDRACCPRSCRTCQCGQPQSDDGTGGRIAD